MRASSVVLILALATVCLAFEAYPSVSAPYPFTGEHLRTKIGAARHARLPSHMRRSIEEARSELRQDRGARSAAIKSMPVGGYIRWFRTHCNSTGNPENFYAEKNHRAYVAVTYYVNEVLGGLLINDTRYLIDDYNMNDGGDCEIIQVLYERAHSLGYDKFFAPTSSDCSVLAKYAESKQILFGNAGDYSLLILAFSDQTTPADATALYVNASAYSYSSLEWTYNMMNDVTKGGQSCAEAATDPLYIDQTVQLVPGQPNRVRTFAAASTDDTVPYLVPQERAALLALNASEVVPYVSWNTGQLLAGTCGYIGPVIDEWVAAQPDLVVAITGATNGSIAFDCMHLIPYQPPLVLMEAFPPGVAPWKTASTIYELPFTPSIDFTDPIFGTYSEFAATYELLYNDTVDFYDLTFAASAVVMLDCIARTQSLDNYVVRECIRAYNGSTIYGDINFQQTFWYVNRPNTCVQSQPDGSVAPVFPLGYPNRVALKMSGLYSLNKTWFEEKHPHTPLSGGQVAAIAIGACVGFVALLGAVGGLGYYLFRRKYHAVVVKKDTWDTATS